MAIYAPSRKDASDKRTERLNCMVTKDLKKALVAVQKSRKKRTSLNDIVNYYIALGIESEQRSDKKQSSTDAKDD